LIFGVAVAVVCCGLQLDLVVDTIRHIIYAPSRKMVQQKQAKQMKIQANANNQIQIFLEKKVLKSQNDDE